MRLIKILFLFISFSGCLLYEAPEFDHVRHHYQHEHRKAHRRPPLSHFEACKERLFRRSKLFTYTDARHICRHYKRLDKPPKERYYSPAPRKLERPAGITINQGVSIITQEVNK